MRLDPLNRPSMIASMITLIEFNDARLPADQRQALLHQDLGFFAMLPPNFRTLETQSEGVVSFRDPQTDKPIDLIWHIFYSDIRYEPKWGRYSPHLLDEKSEMLLKLQVISELLSTPVDALKTALEAQAADLNLGFQELVNRQFDTARAEARRRKPMLP